MFNQFVALLADALAMLLLARCLLQYGRLNYMHPLAQFCCRRSDWLVKPLRRLLPPLGGLDSACILAAWLLYAVLYLLLSLINLPAGMFGWQIAAADVLLAALALTRSAAYVLLGGLLWRMVLSLSQAYSPLVAVLNRVYEPLCRPFAFLRIGRWDFSGSLLALLLWGWISWGLPAIIMHLNFLLLP